MRGHKKLLEMQTCNCDLNVFTRIKISGSATLRDFDPRPEFCYLIDLIYYKFDKMVISNTVVPGLNEKALKSPKIYIGSLVCTIETYIQE